jgi:hypothetical protein
MAVSPHFARLDLLHYVVESELGFEEAFLGLIASGRGLGDFAREAQDWLPIEALWTEVIVSALQRQIVGGATPDELGTDVAAACDGLGLPNPGPVDPKVVERILARHSRLAEAWDTLSPGEVIELPWPQGGVDAEC